MSAVSNYGALAILALPADKILISDLRLLIALETVTPDAMGFRHTGMKLLAQKAQLPYETARKSARRLGAAGLVYCVPGSGKGHVTRWRILFSLTPPKVSTQEGHLTEPQRCPPDPLKVSTVAAKGVQANSVTSANENTGLKQSGLKQSGLPPPRHPARPNGQPDAGADLIRMIIEEIKNATGATISADWASLVKRTILDGRDPARAGPYIRRAIRAEPDPRTRFLPISRPGYQ